MSSSDLPSGPLSGATVGRLRIGPLLGRGGMGEVYRADDIELGRAVALKVLPEHLVGDSDRVARFVREARTASALNHPHLVSIYDIGQGTASTGAPIHFISMELVAGETLRTLLDRRNTDPRRLLDYVAQIADALAAAHGAGIFHRDLKPENVMVADGGYVKLLDFGLAKLKVEPPLLESAAQEQTQTMPAGTAPGIVMGTVGYMSPEQALGRDVDHRSDIFSFGCILYEVAAGARAFTGRSAIETLHQIIHGDAMALSQRAPSTPPELQRIVQKCLHKDPEDRYQSMKDVAVDLRALRRQLDLGSAPIVAVAPASRWQPRAIAAVGVPLVVMSLAMIWFARRAPTVTDPAASLSLQRVTDTGVAIDAVVSPDGKYLAYVSSEGGKQGLYLRQLNGTRPVELLAPDNVGFWGIAFARDGLSIYYGLKTRERPTGELFRIPTLGGAARALLRDIDSSVSPSPDGSQVAFYRVDLAQGSSVLVVANADGSTPRMLVTRQPPEFFAPGFFVNPSWSPDGKRMAAGVRNSATGDARLITIDVGTARETSFPERYISVTATAWLPDGSGILFVGVPVGGWTTGNGGQIFLQPYPSGPPKRITNDVIEYRNVSVSDDGHSLISVGYDSSARLYAISYSGGPERRLEGSRYDGIQGIAWMPDSQRFIFGRIVHGQRTLWSGALDGNDSRELTSAGTAAWPALSADGRILVFVGLRGADTGIWRSDADGGDARLLTKVADATHLAIAPDRSVYFTSGMRGGPATYRVGLDGGEPALVAALLERAAVSHDGRLLAGPYREAARAPLVLGVIDAQTGKPVRLFPDFTPTSASGSVGWEPGNQAIIYSTVERTNVWRRTLADGRETPLTIFSDQAIARFALSPDGRTLLLSRGITTRDAFLISNFR